MTGAEEGLRVRQCPRASARPFLTEANESDNLDARDDVAFQDAIHDVNSLDHLAEDRVIAIQAQIVPEIHEPLRVTGVVAARAHPHGAAHVGNRAELVADEARVSNILIGAGASALNHEVGLDALPGET